MYIKKVYLLIIAIVIFLFTIICTLFYNGILWFNNPKKTEYPIRGVDVSSYQGNIDWEILSQQDISFAFIKASEGSSFEDPYYKTNFQNAIKTDLKIGAYHFFSYDSSGNTQAENFINIVGKHDTMMPPVVDIEFYGDKEKNLPSKEETQINLKELLQRLEEYYEQKPIIYVVNKSYDLYIKDAFEDYPIWIRDVLKKPKLSDGREWTMWQYSNRAKLNGYSGKEKYIDMNVFNGTIEEFERFINQKI